MIELLTVICIIVILAALLLPTMNFMRARADSAQCLAHLRQIGTGIAAYMNDREMMPGPLHLKQGATYKPGEPGSLAALLESYLGTGAASADTTRTSPVFLCPAAYRKSQNKAETTYFVNMLQVPEYTQSIWGDIDQGQQPLARAILSNWSIADDQGHPLSLAEMWALQDADQEYVKQHTNFFTGTMDDLLPHPAHDDHYNALFFDLHVERRVAGLAITEPAPSGTPAPNPSP
ncbi:MAG: type II secretion system protein [Chthoniobacter sp.]|nr:type II secretion system protein [Chthoniobacter sp.]